MANYFENFELIRYNNSLVVNITERTALLNQVFGNAYSFYPYVVKNGMRAEQVAEKYYGDPNFFWLVYFSNNIVDPYHEWVKDEETFRAYIEDKYGSVSAASNLVVSYRVNWAEDTTTLSKTQYALLNDWEKKYWTPKFDNYNLPISYERKRIDVESIAVDENGFVTSTIPEEEMPYWMWVTALDREEEENGKKAHIRLLDNRYAKIAEVNLKDLMSG